MTGKPSAPPQALPKSFHPQQLLSPCPLPNLSSLFSLWWLQPPRASLSKAACKTPSSLVNPETAQLASPRDPWERPCCFSPQSPAQGCFWSLAEAVGVLFACPGISSGLSLCATPSSSTPSLPSFLKLCSWTCLPVPAWLFRTVNSRALSCDPRWPAGDSCWSPKPVVMPWI